MKVVNRMNNIKKSRECAGLSQKEVAVALGVSAPTVSEWESGKKNPSGANLRKLSSLLDVSTDYLLGITESECDLHRVVGGWMTTDALIEALPEEFRVLLQSYRSAFPLCAEQFVQMIDSFALLNDEGRDKLADYATDLVSSGRYIKTDSSGMVREA